MKFQDIIVGGGASGVVTAIMLARKGRKTLVLEAQDRALKKLLASGNGRCNLSNSAVCPERYNAPSFVAPSLSAFGLEEVKDFFLSVGIELREEDGRWYPYSLSAGSVVNALLRAAEKAGVVTVCGAKADRITKDGLFCVSAAGKTCANRKRLFY